MVGIRPRVPVVRQYDRMDCGPAALLSVLRYHGGDASLVQVRDWSDTDAGGASLLGLAQAARRLGFEAVGARGSYADLMSETMPCIAHLVLESGWTHFVVVYHIDEQGVLLGDPAEGRIRRSRDAFERLWHSRSVLLLTPTDALVHDPPVHWIRWIAGYLHRQQAWVVQALFLGGVITALGLLTAVFVQAIIDRFIPRGDLSPIVWTGLFLLFLLMLRAAAGYLRQRFLVVLNKRISLAVTGDFLSHLFHLPRRFFDSHKTGDITARLGDSLKIHQAVLLLTQSTLIDTMILLGSLAFMFVFSVPLALFTLAAVPLYLAVLLWRSRHIREQQHAVLAAHAGVQSAYIDAIHGMADILSTVTGDGYRQLSVSLFSGFQDRIERLGLTRAGLGLVAEVFGAFCTVVILTLGAVWVAGGSLRLGELMATYSLLSYMLPAATALVSATIALQGAHMAARRLRDILLVRPESPDGEADVVLRHSLSLRHARFSYPKGDAVLRDVSLRLEVGTLTGLWGPSGAGKSTVALLLQRLYDLDDGHLLLDDRPATEISRQALRRQVTAVPQQIHIFNATLAENVIMGRPAPDTGSIQDSLQRPPFDRVATRFPRGWSTRLGEDGQTCSGGERQLVGLARALYTEPRVLIVDEGFSALDPETEEMIFSILRPYSRDHVVLVISHHLDTLLQMDRLVCLRQGEVAETGTPTDLLQDPNSHFSQRLSRRQALCSEVD